MAERKGHDDQGAGLRCLHALALAVAVIVMSGCGPRDAPVQAPAHPFGLGDFGPVQAGGSDTWSWWFNRAWLPSLITLANRECTHAAVSDHFDRLALDPTQLSLTESCSVRVYFVGEGSGNKNALGVNLEGVGVTEGRPRILFSSASCPVRLDVCEELVDPRTERIAWEQMGPRTPEQPLWPGDFIDLGKAPAGAALSFFMIVDREKTYTPIAYRNPDSLAHVVAIAVEDSPYLLLSFEDAFQGGDADYDDCVFAVEMSASNIEALLGQVTALRRWKRTGWTLLVLLVVAAGLITYRTMKRRARRNRLARAYNQATELLDAGQAQAAIEIIRKSKEEFRDRKWKDQWTRLEISACEQLGDRENLRHLFVQFPGLFTERESAALTVARIQVEEERFDEYAGLRNAWRDREQTPEAWVALDVDALMKQDKKSAAMQLVEEERYAGERDCGRAVRFALLRARDDPQEADLLLAHAIARFPRHPETHAFRARFLQAQGNHALAIEGFRTALACAPRDPYLLDRLAEAYRRSGDSARALRVWCEGLQAPSMGFLWLKVLFWRRVAIPVAIDWTGLKVPPGPLRPLVEYLFRLEPDRFWDPKAFAAIGDYQPELLSRQEVFWLRVFEAVRTGSDAEALTLLNLQGFGTRSWHSPLEKILLRIVLYRLRKFLGPAQAVEIGPTAVVAPHPLFADFDRWAQHPGIALPEDARQFMSSAYAYAAACFAAGWSEAGLRCMTSLDLPEDAPPWLARDIQHALQRRREAANALGATTQH